MRKRGKKSV